MDNTNLKKTEDLAILSGQYLQEREYWLKKLDGEPVKSTFPGTSAADGVAPQMETTQFNIEGELYQRLKTVSNQSDPRLYMVLVAGLTLLMQRYTGHNDILFGTPIDKQETQGKFINTVLTLRNQYRDEDSFKDLLLQARQTIIEAAENQNYPIERLPLDLGIPTDATETNADGTPAGHTRFPLFDVAILLDTLQDETYLKPVKPEITFNFSHGNQNNQQILQCNVTYNKLRYSVQSVNRIGEHFSRLLKEALFNINEPMGQLEMLSSQERDQLLLQFNDTHLHVPADLTLHRMVEKQAAKTPELTALVDTDGIRVMSYGELNRKAGQLALRLIRLGIKPGHNVALMAHISIETVIGILAVAKAGGAFLPIDPHFPAGRINYILKDSATRVLLTTASLATDIQFDGTLLDLTNEIFFTGLTTEQTPDDSESNNPDNPAYIIYTSGSTGMPKGVIVRHRNIVNQIYGLMQRDPFPVSMKHILLAPFTFDPSVQQVFLPLATGGKLHLVSKATKNDAQELLTYLRSNRIDVLNTVPSLMKVLVNMDVLLYGETSDSFHFTYIILAGELFPTELFRQITQRFTTDKIINIYGPTEAAINTTLYQCRGLDEYEDAGIPIGKPLANYQIYILDKLQRLLPVGVPGELCIAGAGLAMGYLNNPELTDEKFVDYPFPKPAAPNAATPPYQKMYRTGDLAQWLPDGNLRFLGRIDHQVKIRGFRIELGEIENRLIAHDSVKEAVVIAKEDPNKNKYLYAYIVPSGQGDCDVNQLKKYLGLRLPDYMVPSQFVKLHTIPVTAHGKADIKKLQAMDSVVESGTRYLPPRNQLEEKLAQIWKTDLQLDKVGIRDNYFSIGGDSIKSINLLSRINKELDIRLKIVDLYTNDTIETLAAFISGEGGQEQANELDKARTEVDAFAQRCLAQIPDMEEGVGSNGGKDVLTRLQKDNIEDIYPMSDIEKGMVFHSLIDTRHIPYHNQFVYQVQDTQFQPPVFEKAFDLLVQTHHMLRTGFNMSDFSEPVQIVYKNVQTDIRHYDISHMSPPRQEAHLQNFLAEDRQMPFDTEKGGLLWRSRTFRLGKQPGGKMENIAVLWLSHHASFDGWSGTSLMTQLNNIYFTLKEEPNYTPEPIKNSYKQFVIEQMVEKKNPASIDYWQKTLDNYKRLDFTGDRNDINRSGAKKFQTIPIADHLATKLRETAARYHTSLKHICFAAYLYALDMFSYEKDVVVGLVEHNRPVCEDGDKIIGCFLNTVPFRAQVPSTGTWEEFIRSIDGKLVELKNYFKMPLFEISRLIGENSLDENPIFDTIFNYVDFHVLGQAHVAQAEAPTEGGEEQDDPADANQMAQRLSVDEYANTNTLLNVNFSNTLGQLLLIFAYAPEAVAPQTLDRLSTSILSILSRFADAADQPVDNSALINEAQRVKLLEEFNNTQAPFPSDKTIHQLFQEQAQKTPHQIAIIAPVVSSKIDQTGKTDKTDKTDKTPETETTVNTLTYRELNDRANQVAALLRDKGVQPDTLVGIMADRSLQMMIGLFGIIKSGAAYLPIDPSYPQERIDYILQDAQLQWLLLRGDLESNLESNTEGDDQKSSKKIKINDNIQTIDLLDPRIYTGNTANPQIVNTPEHLMYVTYTSGSTGKPNGVMIQHRSVANRLNWMQRQYPLTTQDVILQKTTIVFDVSVWELFWWSLQGATLYLLEPRAEKYPDKIIETIEAGKVTTMHFVPSMLSAFLDSVEESAAAPRLTSLKQVVASGEALPPHLVARFSRLLSTPNNTRLANLYGPTEATVDVTYYDCAVGSEGKEEDIIPIGKPIDNTKIYILDSHLGLKPLGMSGQLCISGVNLARGYWNREELTAKKFVPNPYEPRQRLYLTGDFARWLPDGNIQFLGRIDHQVKIRGFRIEPGEIQNRLQDHPDVRETVVFTGKDKKGEYYLCAYLVADKTLKISQLRDYLSQKVPPYMVPAYFVQVNQIPLTPNGKVDRKALPQPGIGETGVPYVAPRNEVEHKLAAIWAQLLNMDKSNIGIDNNFFELGGHSLKVTVMASRIHKQLDIKIPLAEIYKALTIRKLADYLRDAEIDYFTPIPAAHKQDYYPLSSAQRRLYILNQMSPDSKAYNIPVMMLPAITPDKEKMEAAFKKLIQRHESLRTSFHMVEGVPMQKIHDNVDFAIEYHPLADDDPQAKAKKDKISMDFVRPFDLTRPPLLRVALIQNYKGMPMITIDTHHIISDALSNLVFEMDFAAFYMDVELDPLRVQYKDYVMWRHTAKEKESVKHQEAYWLNKFQGDIPALDLPTDFPRPAVKTFEGAAANVELTPEETTLLKTLAMEAGGTLYMYVLAIYNMFLARITHQEDIVIGTPVGGRRHEDLAGMLGVFINTLALRYSPRLDRNFHQFASEAIAQTFDSFENQDYQFEDLINNLNVPRDLSRNPLFDTMFMLQTIEVRDGGIPKIRFPREEQDDYEYENYISKFDITLLGLDDQNILYFTFEYATGLFKEETMDRLANSFNHLVRQVIANPRLPLSHYDLLPDEEKQKVLVQFNDTAADYPQDVPIHQLFQEQAQRTPEAIALVAPPLVVPRNQPSQAAQDTSSHQRLTYSELNKITNRLAHHLKETGIGPDSITGIMVDPSPEMLVAIIAVLKAGGAYLPIPTDYPAERIRFTLKDSDAVALITHAPHTAPDTAPDSNQSWGTCPIIDILDANVFPQKDTNPEIVNQPQHLAYAIYTSGSTGKPKGVQIQHRSLSNLRKGITDLIPFTTESRILSLTTIAFDIFVFETLLPLTCGSTVVIGNKEQQKDAAAVAAVVESEGITHLQVTPSRLQVLTTYTRASDIFKSLQVLVSGGESFPQPLFDRTRELTHARIFNLYAPSETTVYSTFAQLKPGQEITIGKPIANTRIYIVNSQNSPQPIGVYGEIYIAGDGLARGYFGDASLGDGKFVDNPFEEGKPMYRTGDLGRWMPDGTIQFADRIDRQVKIRGYRIELAEIEDQLRAHSQIEDAVVLDGLHETGEKYLCAYLVPTRKELDVDVSQLRIFLSQKLPTYMIPSYFVMIPEIPLTSSGKVNRKGLPGLDGRMAQVAYEAPRTPLEETLLHIFRSILNSDKIGIENDFFASGGNSLNAMMVISEIYKELKVEISLTWFFTNPRVKDIANHMQTQYGSGEISYMLLNQAGNPGIFALPPGTAYGLAYKTLAGNLPHHSFYAFNFIEAEDRIQQYANAIVQLQPEGPYVLFGWSAGGILAFEVAKELEKRGCVVSDLIYFDTERVMVQRDDISAQEEQEFYQLVESDLKASGLGFLRDTVLDKIKKYTAYLKEIKAQGIIDARIHQVLGDDRDESVTLDQWREATKQQYSVHRGVGPHGGMMSPGWVEGNAQIVARILNETK